MTTQTRTPATPAQIRDHLQLLLVERALAGVEGLAGNAAYMTDLDDEIAATRSAFVGAAVTDIAILRSELSGRLHG